MLAKKLMLLLVVSTVAIPSFSLATPSQVNEGGDTGTGGGGGCSVSNLNVRNGGTGDIIVIVSCPDVNQQCFYCKGNGSGCNQISCDNL